MTSSKQRNDENAKEHTVPYVSIVLQPKSANRMSVVSQVNPFSKQHGAPSDTERHVGDLGNFNTDAQGNSKGSVTDGQIKLIGPESVLGVCLALLPYPKLLISNANPRERFPAHSCCSRWNR